MPVGAAIGAAGSIGGALIGSSAARKASSQQAAAQQAALAQQNALFQQALGVEQPFANIGQAAGNSLLGLLTPGPNQNKLLEQLPGFQFAQNWGQKAVQNIGSTMGFGGNTLKAGADYATGVAQQGFGTLAGLLQNLTNTGAGAANTVMGAAVGQSANIGNTMTNLGQAQAFGTLGSANALSGGLTGATNSATNALILPQLLQAAQKQQPGAPSGIYSGSPFLPMTAQYGNIPTVTP